MPARCAHLDQIKDVEPGTPNGCEECLKMGDRWVHLRLCLTCGHVGCCDLAEQARDEALPRHHHPIIRSRSSRARTGAGATSTSS